MRDAVRNKERWKGAVRLPKILVLTCDGEREADRRAAARVRRAARHHKACLRCAAAVVVFGERVSVVVAEGIVKVGVEAIEAVLLGLRGSFFWRNFQALLLLPWLEAALNVLSPQRYRGP